MHEGGAHSFVHCENLVKIFKIDEVEVVALQGLDLTVEKAEMMAIIGPSGSGKSSLLNVLGGLDAPTAGKARVADTNLIGLTDNERVRYRRTTVGFVWQNVSRNLVPYLSAMENVQLPMILDGVYNRERAKELLTLVGLGNRLRHNPGRLSGGEQQRVAVAIALANQPAVLLADEPTGSLDAQNARQVIEVLDAVRRALGVTVIIVTHDRSMARNVDRYVEIRDGKTSREAIRRVVYPATAGPAAAATVTVTAAAAAVGASGRAPADTGASPAAPAADTTEPAASHPIAPAANDPTGPATGQGTAPAGHGDRLEDSHEQFVLLDSAGRLQLPPELRAQYGITRRVRLIDEGDRIAIYPPERPPSAGN